MASGCLVGRSAPGDGVLLRRSLTARSQPSPMGASIRPRVTVRTRVRPSDSLVFPGSCVATHKSLYGRWRARSPGCGAFPTEVGADPTLVRDGREGRPARVVTRRIASRRTAWSRDRVSGRGWPTLLGAMPPRPWAPGFDPFTRDPTPSWRHARLPAYEHRPSLWARAHPSIKGTHLMGVSTTLAITPGGRCREVVSPRWRAPC